MNKYQLAEEFVDCLVTCELAVAYAEERGYKPNSIIKHCCNELLKRIKGEKNRKAFERLKRQPYPLGALKQYRRFLDECN